MRETHAITEALARAAAEGRVVEHRPTAPVCIVCIPQQYATEDDFQADVIRHATARGWLVYHTRDSRKSAEGFPDLVLLRGDRQVVAELKIGNKKPTRTQQHWLDHFEAAGVETHVWRPADWKEIEEALR